MVVYIALNPCFSIYFGLRNPKGATGHTEESLPVHSKSNTVCPTRYRTRHFFNNFTTNEDIVTKFEADYRHIPRYFSHNEHTPVQIPLHYLHWCWNY